MPHTIQDAHADFLRAGTICLPDAERKIVGVYNDDDDDWTITVLTYEGEFPCA